MKTCIEFQLNYRNKKIVCAYKWAIFLFVLISFICSRGFAQSLIVGWDVNGYNSWGKTPSPQSFLPTTNPGGVIAVLKRGSGTGGFTVVANDSLIVGGNPVGYHTNAWGGYKFVGTGNTEAGVIANNSYLYSVIQAPAGNTISIDSFKMYFQRFGTGSPTHAYIQYSIDSTNFIDLYMPPVTSGATTLIFSAGLQLDTVTALQNVAYPHKIFFRIVPVVSNTTQQAGGWFFSDGNMSSAYQNGADIFLTGFVTPQENIWTGNVSSDWNTNANWTSNVPLANANVIIPDISPSPIINSDTFSIAKLTMKKGSSLTINGQLNITGDIIDTGVISGTGKLMLNGLMLQHISGKGTISNIELNNLAGATIVSDTLSIKNSLVITAGNLTTSNHLLLLSDHTGTARIGNISGMITGDITIQQYIPGGRRAFRFISHPFTTSLGLNQLSDSLDITGQGGSANGFANTLTNNPSSFWYNTLTGNGSVINDYTGWKAFTAIDGINDNAWKQYQGIRLLVRGRKNQGLDGQFYVPDSVTIATTGQVNYGPVSIPMIVGSQSSYNILGNPYPSPVDIGSVINTAKAAGRISGSAFWVWDPNEQTQGAYIPLDITATPHYYLPQQGVFEVKAAIAGTLDFIEGDKNPIATSALLKTTNGNSGLLLHIYDSSYHSWDRMYIRFNNQATAGIDDFDAAKQGNPDLDFYSLSADGGRLCINTRPYLQGQVIPLGIFTSNEQEYILKAEDYSIPENEQLILHDKYLASYQILQQDAEYHFHVTDDTASAGGNRFELITLGQAETIEKTENAVKDLQITLAPNPTVSQLTVYYKAPVEQAAQLRIIDFSGRIIFKTQFTLNHSGDFNIPLENVCAGIYNVEVLAGPSRVIQSFIKL